MALGSLFVPMPNLIPHSHPQREDLWKSCSCPESSRLHPWEGERKASPLLETVFQLALRASRAALRLWEAEVRVSWQRAASLPGPQPPQGHIKDGCATAGTVTGATAWVQGTGWSTREDWGDPEEGRRPPSCCRAQVGQDGCLPVAGWTWGKMGWGRGLCEGTEVVPRTDSDRRPVL